LDQTQKKLLAKALTEYEKAAKLDSAPTRALETDEYGRRSWLPVAYSGLARHATEFTGWELAVWQKDDTHARGRAALLGAMGLGYAATGSTELATERRFAHQLALEAYPDFVASSYSLALELHGPAQVAQLQHVVGLAPEHFEANNLLARHHGKKSIFYVFTPCLF
jgi:hypothetical protein